MPNNVWKVTTIVLAIGLVHDMKITTRYREAHESNVKKITALTELTDHLFDEVNFLCSKLNEAGVEITEFDRIAFKNSK